MKGSTKISRLFFYLIFSIALAFAIGFSTFWTLHEVQEYKEQARAFYSNYISVSQTNLKREVQSFIHYIEYRKSNLRSGIKKEIRDSVIDVNTSVGEIYEKYRGHLPDSEIKNIIKDFLKNFRHRDEQGYFFLIDMAGQSESPAVSILGKSGEAAIQDLGGRKCIDELIRVGRESGEGFAEHECPKPGAKGGQFQKITFVKLFEPYKWLIGSGEYLDDEEKNLQREILEWLNELHYGNESYIAAFSFEGVNLAFYKKEEVGRKRVDYGDPDGIKLVEQGVRLSKTPEGGFVEYVSPLGADGKPERKIFFFLGVPDWQWAIGTGVSLDDADSYIAAKESELSESVTTAVVYILIVFLVMGSVLVGILALIFRRINAGFHAFSSFFDRAAEESILIDPGKLDFAEFRSLALSANRMVAQRRKAEEAVRSSETRYRAIVEDQTELICRFLPDGCIIFINDAFCRFFGKSRKDVLLGNLLTYFHEPDISELQAHICFLTPENPVATLEYRAISEEGKVRWLQWTDRAIFDQYNKIIEYQGVGRDITEQKRAERALFESERRFREMLEKVRLAAIIMDTECNILFCNDFLLEISGWTKDEVLARNWFDVFIPDEGKEHLEILYREKMPADEFPGYHESEILTRSGERRLIAWNNTPVRNDEGKVVGGTSIGEDITERRQAEAERIRLVTAIEQSAEAVLIADTNWSICYVNPAFERISGYSKGELIGQASSIIGSAKHDSFFFGNMRESLSRGDVWSGRITSARKNETTYEAEVTASPVRDKSGTIINFVSIHRDITHEIKLERDLRQAQKMEAIGTLAGGIAHDFNNILTAIIGYTEMAQFKIPEGNALRPNLEQVLKASARAKDLVKQILTFSTQTEQERKPVQLSPTIREALKLLRSSLPTTIEILQDIDSVSDDDVVLADPTQLHQVLMNLCTNSAHAMRAHGGKLCVGLSEVEGRSVSGCPDIKTGKYMKLMVSDNGHGMGAATLERIFDPYFTTKKAGEGTGMGLAVVQGIVKNLGGSISVYSEPGVGTTFSVYLPKTGEVATPPVEVIETLPHGNERILFVDDECELAELGKEMLETVGYLVTTQTSSIKALETFREHPDDFDLVITDMTMPALTGLELSRELLSIRPRLPIIMCTGFSDALLGDQHKSEGICEILMKPYAINHLARTIREVLTRQAQV